METMMSFIRRKNIPSKLGSKAPQTPDRSRSKCQNSVLSTVSADSRQLRHGTPLALSTQTPGTMRSLLPMETTGWCRGDCSDLADEESLLPAQLLPPYPRHWQLPYNIHQNKTKPAPTHKMLEISYSTYTCSSNILSHCIHTYPQPRASQCEHQLSSPSCLDSS